MSDTVHRLYDSHAHLVSDDLVRYPRNYLVIHRPGGVNPFAPGTVGQPGGMHGPDPVNEKPTAEKMHDWMRELNIDGIAAVQKGMVYRTDNSYIVDAADAFPDEMRAVIIIDPREAKTLQMIRDLSRRGIVGVRFFPINVPDKAVWLSSPEAMEVYKLTNELGLVLDIEGPSINPHLLIPIVELIADRFPTLPIVLDHIFLPVVTDPDYGIGPSFDGFARRDNITVKWTSLNMDVIREKGIAPEAVLRRAVDFFGADKVMWGSDVGTSSGTYHELVERGIASTILLNDQERRKVLHDTGRRIFAPTGR